MRAGETACIACQRNALRRTQSGSLWDIPHPLIAPETRSEEPLQDQEAQRRAGMPFAYAMWIATGLGVLLFCTGQTDLATLCGLLSFILSFYLVMSQKSSARTNGWVWVTVSTLIGSAAYLHSLLS
ncbi:hypothetical protein CCAX7_10350 [Capsulimonas corticalis]|uniref:Uncharacterized protein n=1 Tax=Capsulimonas corticalis TaxID=2219043 RepID=A0A402CUJ3_9BACT|nr:hypothetical protein CCAX7_10350 [Capsulimonas corticalis]